MFTESVTRRTLRRVVDGVAHGVAAVADPLATPYGVDPYLEQVFPTWSTTEVRGRVVDVDRSAAGSVVLTIVPNSSWTGFHPGQHTQLSVEIDGVRHTRCYSMANSATDSRRLQLGIKAHPEGLVSRHLLAHARRGMVVGLTRAAGDFHLPVGRPHHLLLISGGSGVTPVLSMLRTLCAEGHSGDVTFLYYANAPETMLFREEISAMAATNANVRVLTAFEQRPEAGDLIGLLDESHLAAADPQWAEAETYACGPAPLMDGVRSLYDEAGATERFHQEAFTLPHFVGEAGSVGGSLRFAASDSTVESDGRVILEQAEAAGLAPESGCRMGICRTCTCSLTAGAVRNAVTGEITENARSSNRGVDIQICVNVPVGDVDIDL